MQVENIDHFSEDGKTLFIRYKIPSETLDKTKVPNAESVQVDLWSYRDTKLQSEQLYDLRNRPYQVSYSAAIQIKSHQVFLLEQAGENILECNEHFALIYRKEGDAGGGEENWNPACRASFYLVSTCDGSRKLIKEHTRLLYKLSPEGKYLIYYEPKLKNYFSLEVLSGVTKNITKAIRTNWTEYKNDNPSEVYQVNAITGWLKGDAAVLLHDQNDIWEVDLSGNNPPLNLTNGYGQRNQIVFRLATEEGHAIFSPDEKILLSAFNRFTKENGFFRKARFQKGDPVLLTMGHYVFEVPGNNPDIDGRAPLKARDAEAYIVRRMGATESPNYFYTKDLIHFNQMSYIHPEKEYNWLTTELVSWKTFNGSMAQGVLYKPENFDSKKKYPIIFYYYERLSDELNEFKQPAFSMGRLDIPSYVSNGYLVFTPDIHYMIGETGESCVNSVVSAAKFLMKMPWVDSLKNGAARS